MKTFKKIIIGIAIFFAVLIGLFFIYVSDYYHTDETELQEAEMNTDLTIEETDGAVIIDPGDADTAIIFYPGGKVEYTAYEPLLIELAESGIMCILPEMPFNLAVFDIDAADEYISEYDSIDHWYLAGHSLGGSMAASYVGENADKVDGLILLAAYSTIDLSEDDINVLSIYGSNDGVLNMESYEKYLSNLPDDYSEIVIEGGNHAGFGCYGDQEGDGEADITNEEQQNITAQDIIEFIQENT